MSMQGKTVVITGATSGIGEVAAMRLAEQGARIVFTARDKARADDTLAKLRQANPGADHAVHMADLSTLAEMKRVGGELAQLPQIDVLINNAGAGIYQPSWEMPMEEARYLMELNFFAPLAMTQLVVPHMRARRSGMLVNMGSIGGKVVLPWLTLYSVTKSALGSLTEGQRVELMGDGVRTMLVCPGYVKTGFQQNVRAGQAPDRVQKARRFAITPEECALAIRRGVERDARTVVTPRSGWLLVLAMRLFPSIVEARMAAINGTA